MAGKMFVQNSVALRTHCGVLTGTPPSVRVNGVYRAFNDFWRPAVLFRLGYPIRNVAEGQIRLLV